MSESIIIYLIGWPGVGKLTIAKEILKNDKSFILCDNHLINNVIFSLLRLNEKYIVPEESWDYIGKIRDIVFDFITQDKKNNYILTNVLNNDEGDKSLFQKVENLAKRKNALLVPVKLFAEYDIHSQRIQNIEREKLFKSRDLEDIMPYESLLKISHENLLEIDTTNLSAAESAKKIQNHIQNLISLHK
jgi:hypothetical protein